MMDPGGGGRFQRGGGGGGKLLGWFHSVFLVMESCLCFHALKQQSRSPSILASDPKCLLLLLLLLLLPSYILLLLRLTSVPILFLLNFLVHIGSVLEEMTYSQLLCLRMKSRKQSHFCKNSIAQVP